MRSLSLAPRPMPMHSDPHMPHTVGAPAMWSWAGPTGVTGCCGGHVAALGDLHRRPRHSIVAFYTQVLSFTLVRDERTAPVGYVALDRDGVHIGAAYRGDPVDRSARRPPTGIELVLE